MRGGFVSMGFWWDLPIYLGCAAVLVACVVAVWRELRRCDCGWCRENR